MTPDRAFSTVASNRVLRLDSVGFLGAAVLDCCDNKFTELYSSVRGIEHKAEKWRKSHLFNTDESVVLANLNIAAICQFLSNELLKIRLRNIVDHL